MAIETLLGPGTLTVGTTPLDFSCEVLGGKVTHSYEDIGEKRTMLCGTEKPAQRKRTDGLTFNLENDLSGAGLYKWLLDHDLATEAFVYTPNTAAGAKWEGDFQATLPADIGADEFGSPIVSAVEWEGVGAFTFTPSTPTP